MQKPSAAALAFASESELWAWVRARRKERRGHAQLYRRKYFAQRLVSDCTVAAACAWLLPWHRDHYPGVRRGLFQVLNGVKATAIDKWRYGLAGEEGA